jgi:hypothetical protein
MHGSPPRAEIAPDGTFVLADVTVGTYSLPLSDLPVYFKSVTFAGQAVAYRAIQIPAGTAGPLEIVAGTKLGQVSGVVDGEPWTAILLIPDEPGTVRVAVSDASGAFTIDAVRPGKYKAAALAFADPTLPPGAAEIELVNKQGTSITVQEDSQLTLQLRPIQLP